MHYGEYTDEESRILQRAWDIERSEDAEFANRYKTVMDLLRDTYRSRQIIDRHNQAKANVDEHFVPTGFTEPHEIDDSRFLTPYAQPGRIPSFGETAIVTLVIVALFTVGIVCVSHGDASLQKHYAEMVAK